MMALSADNKRIYIRRAVFALLLLATAVIQNTKGFLPEPFGVKLFLLFSYSVL